MESVLLTIARAVASEEAQFLAREVAAQDVIVRKQLLHFLSCHDADYGGNLRNHQHLTVISRLVAFISCLLRDSYAPVQHAPQARSCSPQAAWRKFQPSMLPAEFDRK
jgi:hypothetical protein